MVTSYHRLLRCNKTTKEDDNTLPSSSYSLQHHHKRSWHHIVVIFFFSNTKKIKHTTQKPRKGSELTFKLSLCPSLLVFASTLLFQTLSPDIFFFSSRRKKKQRKKNIEKKNAEKGGSLPSSSHSTLSLLAFASTLPLLPFCFKRFLLASSSS